VEPTPVGDTSSSKPGVDKAEEKKGTLDSAPAGPFTLEDLEGEVLQFPTNCPSCGSPCTTNMKMTSILSVIRFSSAIVDFFNSFF